MRILSQDGKIDFPYERVCLEVSDSGKIFAQGDIWGTKDNYIEVARYDSEAKAKRAMEMLHGAYVAHTQFKIMTEVQRSVFLSSVSEKEQNNLYGLFQFPSDDEAEV